MIPVIGCNLLEHVLVHAVVIGMNLKVLPFRHEPLEIKQNCTITGFYDLLEINVYLFLS